LRGCVRDVRFCVRGCVSACVRARMSAFQLVCVCVHACMRACVRECVCPYHAHTKTQTQTKTKTRIHIHTHTNTHTHARAHARTHARTARTPAAPTAHSGRRPYCSTGSVGGAGAVRRGAVRGVWTAPMRSVGQPHPARRGRVGVDRSIAEVRALPWRPPQPRTCALSVIDHARAYLTGGATTSGCPWCPTAAGACARMRRRQANKHTNTHSARPRELGCSACGSPAGRRQNNPNGIVTGQQRAAERSHDTCTRARTQARTRR
jgi:hypothetical protein